ncbi:MAG: IS66 family transposase [Alphaproteobacteria bacterium]|nr:IS66 family transposase [Alphaproteobacteria bacterium]MBU1280733.1 IS66 family transposase [Alphaproteobacteria bacterium]MBU1573342.1 IS66 family transposase [Alphaproteobacteria bacterium]MBU1828483.1 IS66 family transposase [Alphaproteobacteria bacterium]MBU2077312.1 IS66 family transposase [Alphaproteobacteria bacterium]
MDTIQEACAQLAGHHDRYVQKLSDVIEQADRQRDIEYGKLQTKLFKAMSEIKALRSELKRTRSQVEALNTQVAEQAARTVELLHEQYSPKSESAKAKRRQEAMRADDQSEGSDPSSSRQIKKFAVDLPQRPRNRKGRGAKNWDGLERIPIPMEFPKTCPCGCGGTIRDYDIDEKREVVPAKFYIAVRKYPRYRCRKDDVTVGTLYKPTLMPGSTSGTSMLAYLVTMRYGWGMPLYRIENMLNHSGITYYRSTMCKQIRQFAVQLKNVAAELERHTLDDALRIFFDETVLKILRPGEGKTGHSYMYAAHRDDSSFGGNAPSSTVYFHRTSRSMAHIHGILGGKSLIVQHDGYAGYGRLGQMGTDVENIVSVECWVHARRNFIKAAKSMDSRLPNEVVEIMAELFDVENTVRGHTPNARLKYRRERSEEVVNRLHSKLLEISARWLKKDSLGKAINYTLERWDSLTLFLRNGYIDLDTNPVERQFKPIILQRKGSLFIGSEEGGSAWATMSSLVETCKLNRVDVYRYFAWMIDDLAEMRSNYLDEDIDYSRYLPWNAPEHCKVKLPPVK